MGIGPHSSIIITLYLADNFFAVSKKHVIADDDNKNCRVGTNSVNTILFRHNGTAANNSRIITDTLLHPNNSSRLIQTETAWTKASMAKKSAPP